MRLLLSVATLALAARRAAACICTMEYDPVCANGKQYGNACQAGCDGLGEGDYTKGPCKTCNCNRMWKPVCANGKQYSNSCVAECAGAEDFTEGPCEDKEPVCKCTREFNQVCGADGKTYNNPCLADCAKVDVLSEGPCEGNGGGNDTCDKGCVSWFDGCNTCRCNKGKADMCTEMFCDQYKEPKCLKYGAGGGGNICCKAMTASCLACAANVSVEDYCKKKPDTVGCEKDDDKCALKMDAGPCKASFQKFYYDKAAGECKQFTYGGCQGNANRFETMADCQKACGKDDGGNNAKRCPADCSNWYDGCNYCKCNGLGQIESCTRRFCVRMEEPKCMDEDSPVEKQPCKKLSQDECNSRDDCQAKGKKCRDKKEKKPKQKKCKQLKSADACAARKDCKAKNKTKKGRSKFQKCLDAKKGR